MFDLRGEEGSARLAASLTLSFSEICKEMRRKCESNECSFLLTFLCSWILIYLIHQKCKENVNQMSTIYKQISHNLPFLSIPLCDPLVNDSTHCVVSPCTLLYINHNVLVETSPRPSLVEQGSGAVNLA